jgi:hypothetical protein
MPAERRGPTVLPSDIYPDKNPGELMSPSPGSFTAFEGHTRLLSGALPAVAQALKRALNSEPRGRLAIFDDTTGLEIEIDTRGSETDVIERLMPEATDPGDAEGPLAIATTPRGRGRPRLGVVAREVTLLPRHWEWLATQNGGASVALRKLVESARHSHAESDRRRAAQGAAYAFMSTMAGDLPGFEEAARALFAGDRERFAAQIAAWPHDVAIYATELAFP